MTTQLSRNPLCLFTPLANSLLLQSHFSFTYLETLLGVRGSRPPWPQVTCKLTFPFPSPPHSFPIPNSQHPRLIVRLTKTTLWSRLLMVRNTYQSKTLFLFPSTIRQYFLLKGCSTRFVLNFWGEIKLFLLVPLDTIWNGFNYGFEFAELFIFICVSVP